MTVSDVAVSGKQKRNLKGVIDDILRFGSHGRSYTKNGENREFVYYRLSLRRLKIESRV